MADTIGHTLTPYGCQYLFKEMPDPLDDDEWWRIGKILEAEGVPADEVERGVALFRRCGALGMTCAEIMDYCNENEHCEGSKAWRAKSA